MSLAIIYFILLPWENKVDPEGFNYGISIELLFVLLVGMVCGLLLGLFVCQGIAEAHGGTLHFASTPSQGTVVTVTLPAG